MTRTWQSWGGVGCLLAAILTVGCNPFLLPYFLMMGIDPTLPAECKISPNDKDSEHTVVILASNGLETRPEFLRADHEITQLMISHLQKSFKENKEKVQIVPLSKVNRFKDENPRWQTLPPAEIGKHFEADFVINVEINSLSMYEPGSGNTLFHGHAAISVDAMDVNKAEEGPVYRKEYRCEFPRGRSVPVSDTHPQKFRLDFYSRIARDLARLFTRHPYDDIYEMD